MVATLQGFGVSRPWLHRHRVLKVRGASVHWVLKVRVRGSRVSVLWVQAVGPKV